jgi:hypothetical protein
MEKKSYWAGREMAANNLAVIMGLGVISMHQEATRYVLLRRTVSGRRCFVFTSRASARYHLPNTHQQLEDPEHYERRQKVD